MAVQRGTGKIRERVQGERDRRRVSAELGQFFAEVGLGYNRPWIQVEDTEKSGCPEGEDTSQKEYMIVDIRR